MDNRQLPQHDSVSGHRAARGSSSDATASHVVQFYEDETFLTDCVADFGAEALRANRSLILIATSSHCNTFLDALAKRGLDLHDLRRRGRLTVRDARETLSRFVVDGVTDRSRFASIVRPLLEKGERASVDGRTFAFGEMVDLMWRDGNQDALVRLEELWNELADEYDFSLLCAYDLSNFALAAHTEAFGRICAQHTHVRPSEQYPHRDDEARMIEICRLQQRIRVLEAQIEHERAVRVEAEAALRASLRDRAQ